MWKATIKKDLQLAQAIAGQSAAYLTEGATRKRRIRFGLEENANSS